jgi:hypothetical protein
VTTLTLVLMATLASIASQPTPQTHPSEIDRRGAHVMGFDQSKTTHHFLLYEDGGSIEVSVKDPADNDDLDAIRAHLPHIAAMFAAGDFDAPMLVHDAKVPGTSEMARMKERLTYRFVRTPNGGRVDITTTDPDALAAVHKFLRFQISDHHTGDSTKVRKR